MIAFLSCNKKLASTIKFVSTPPHVQISRCSAQALLNWPWFSFAHFFEYTLLLQSRAFDSLKLIQV
jgi:hypothetical protein